MEKLNRFQELIVVVIGAAFSLFGTHQLVTAGTALQNLGLTLLGVFMVIYSQTILKS